MRIGLTFDLKEEAPRLPDPDLSPNGILGWPGGTGERPGSDFPDDFQEEFDSPATISALATVLRELGHEVLLLGDGPALLKRLLADPPHFVFNIAEGQGVGRAREARVPAVLEMLNIPYSGSDPLTLAVTLDKDCAKRLVASAGVPVPAGMVISADKPLPSECPTLQFPFIVKPAWEGSSKGIRRRCVVEEPSELAPVVAELGRAYGQPVLVEEFIEGDELTVGVLGNAEPHLLGIMRVIPVEPTERFVYSLEVKRDYRRLVKYECPPSLPRDVLTRIERAALDSYRVLGCRDVARVDFRLRDGIPYFLEVNPLPGINPETSDLVIMAKSCGWTYSQLIRTILQNAFQRSGIG